LGFVYRVVFLDSVPRALWEDELFNMLSIGNLAYNLHSVDGDFLPLFYGNIVGELRGQESLYLYLSIPSILVFGFTQFGLRFSSVWVGTLSIFVAFLFVKRFFNYRVALFAVLFLAVSPWHIQFSRAGFRVILVPLLVPFSFYLLKRGLDGEKKCIILSSLFFGLSLYTYTVVLVFLPLVLLSFLVIYRKSLLKFKRELLISVLILSLFCVPIIFNSLSNPHVSATSVFSPNCEVLYPDTPDNKFVAVISNYLTFFSPDFLFFNGDVNERHSVRGVGMMHVFELPFFLIGLFFVLFKRSKSGFFVLFWLLLSVIPASFTCGPTNGSRCMPALPVLSVFSGLGLFVLVGKLVVSVKGKRYDVSSLSQLFLVGIFIFSIFNLYSYSVEYFVDYPVYSELLWGVNHLQATNYLMSVYDDYDVFYNFMDVFLFYVSDNKSNFYYPNRLRGQDIPNSKFEYCSVLKCDYSRNHLLYVFDRSVYLILQRYFDLSVKKEIRLSDGSVRGWLVVVNH